LCNKETKRRKEKGKPHIYKQKMKKYRLQSIDKNFNSEMVAENVRLGIIQSERKMGIM
jgi:hypothetical protein